MECIGHGSKAMFDVAVGGGNDNHIANEVYGAYKNASINQFQWNGMENDKRWA
jgi:hypothetical protein